jgi:four helix bundle protein
VNNILNIVDTLENKTTLVVIGRQISRSSTSVGANYRASGRAKSLADMINKLKITEEEADETIYWLEILQHRTNKNLNAELKEGKEFLAIVVSSINTLRKKQNKT